MPKPKSPALLKTDPTTVPKVHLIASWLLSTAIWARLTKEEVEQVARWKRPQAIQDAFWAVLQQDCRQFLEAWKGTIPLQAETEDVIDPAVTPSGVMGAGIR